MTTDNVLRAVLTLGVTAVLVLVQCFMNLKRAHRARQTVMPVMAALVGVTGMVLASVYRRYAQILCVITPFLQDAEILILNIAIYVLYLTVKVAALPIVSAIWKRNDMTERTSSAFYSLDEHFNEWFLRKRAVSARSIAKAVTAGLGLCSAAILCLMWCKGSNSSIWAYVYPYAVLLFGTEVFAYLNGITKEEFTHDVGGAEADSRKIKSYYKLREIYEDLFPQNILAAHTGSEMLAQRGGTQTIRDLWHSDDPVERNVATYFDSFENSGSFDDDCINATVRLLHGHGVVFFDPFYRDLTPYLTLPFVEALLNNKYCLVVCGRSTTAEDARIWAEESLKEYSHVRSLWRVRELGKEIPECEVGILSFRQLFDVDVLRANRDFFCRVGFVLLLEPSVMVNTGQVGISVICEETSRFGDPPVYCICDRYVDGLVDTMSHLLKAELTDAVATPVPKSMYTGMGWDADGDYLRRELFDKQTRYLGCGVELAAVAVKNQVPTVTWYGERKAPLRDIRWIAGQYYSTICRYMGIDIHQRSLYEHVKFVPALWSTAAEKDQFIIVEDEFCNLFNTMNAFLSRGSDHSFVNVLSENYLLRDYMRCNQQMFRTNANAIPTLVPDYAKTERNTVLKLIIKMAVAPVNEEDIRDELLLVGCHVQDVLDTFSKLMEKYTGTDGKILEVTSVRENDATANSHNINYYSISRGNFDAHFSRTLKSAYYIVEEERRESEYIDAKMFGHVAQTVLPGQLVTYFGKYYQVKLVSPENGVILRRASDLYTGRRYYRQIRKYHFNEGTGREIKYSRTVMDLEVSIFCCDFSVSTSGFLDMDSMNDLRTAKVVSYQGDPNSGDYNREYRSKNVLRIRLPDSDNRVRFTLSILLSELFHTVFPDAWQYLAVLTPRPRDVEGMLNYMVYDVAGDISDDYIYIVEDSDLDLGLLDAVNKNLNRLLETLCDFLDWHFEKMRESERSDPVPEKVKIPEESKKRRGLFLRMADRIRRLFSRKSKDDEPAIGEPEKVELEAGGAEEVPEPKDSEDTSDREYELDPGEGVQTDAVPLPAGETDGGDFELEEDGGSAQPQEKAVEVPLTSDDEEDVIEHLEEQLEADSEEDADLIHIDGTDIFEDEGMPDDDLWLEESFHAAGITPMEKSRYQRECYLKFGFDEIDGRLTIEDVHRYLHVRGYANNALTAARRGEKGTEKGLDTQNHCDFCGRPLSGVSYEMLNDGRVRCNACSATAIVTVEEFKEVFYKTVEMMEMFYEVSFHVPISVKMADARTVSKGVGSVFRPSTQVAARTLGYAQRKRGAYSVVMENGSPRLATVDTMVHELTHIWQYLNWKDAAVESAYGMKRSECFGTARDIVYEGMAMWASVQYLYQIGETYYASQQEEAAAARDDIYGIGFRLYREQYPLIKDMSVIKYSPYKDFPTIDPGKVRDAVRARCSQKRCVC